MGQPRPAPGSPVLGIGLDPQTRRSPPESGSRKSAEGNELPPIVYRKMGERRWANPEMPRVFKVLQLQRLETRML